MTYKDFLPDLDGKCISIKIADNDYWHVLDNPRFEYQGGRLFILGTIPDGSTDCGWSNGQTCGIAWDQVINYVLFESLESYKNAVAASEDHQEKEESEKDN